MDQSYRSLPTVATFTSYTVTSAVMANSYLTSYQTASSLPQVEAKLQSCLKWDK